MSWSSVIRATLVITVLAVLTTATLPVLASFIEGYIYTPFNTPQSELSICAAQDGNLLSYSRATSNAADPVGKYSLGVLPTGYYEMLFNEKDQWPRAFRFNVYASLIGTTINYRINYQDHITGITWDPYLRTEWCQSFRATGSSIISVGLHQAIEFGPNTTVSIHDTDPTGAQIGPSRTIPTNIANATSAYWSAGEVPTTPGHIYCVKFTVPGGHRPFLSGTKIQGGNAYPDGRTWRDGQLTNGPIKMVVGQDDDGIITVVSTKKTNSSSLPLGYFSCLTAGQTFVGKGTSVLSVSLLVGSTGGKELIASVHDGPGADGQGGPQIGPAKYIKPVDWNNRSGTVWKPGEVPIQDGRTYYMKIRRADGQAFTMYNANGNDYASGTAYKDGMAQTIDLTTTICCEAYTGSTSVQKVGISNISVARGTTSATITWTTSTATTTNYVDYGVNTPYTSQIAETGPASTTHSVTINGLDANTQYHYRVVSKTAGYRDAYSRDFVFVTNPVYTNLVQNPGFESGTYGAWTTFNQSGDMGLRNYPADGTNAWFWGIKAHTGNWFFGSVSNGGICKGGAYQRVAVDPGRPLKLRAWLWTWQADNKGAFLSYTCRGRVGIDIYGGTDPNSANVAWGPEVVAQDLFGNSDGIWNEAWVSAVPVSSTATVFLQAGADSGMAWTVYGWDDIVCTQEPEPVVPLEHISNLPAVTDGTRVSIPGLKVISTALQTGAAYVEEIGRFAGLRIESTETFAVGDLITIKGTVGTKASGERYLYDVVSTSKTPSAAINSMATVAENIGTVKPGCVGMLMRVAGKVYAGGAGYVYINDGSLPGSGLKVITSSLTTPPAAGSFAGVTGVVQLQGATPAAAIPVLYPRSQADCQTW